MLSVKDVDFVRDGKLLLDGVSWTVGAAERWALLGPNGAGKSTLLGLCGAITHPTRGTVEILGRRLGSVDIRVLRESIGHVNPRHPLRSPLTLLQVVLTGLTGTTELMLRWQPTPAQRTRALELIDLLRIGPRAGDAWTTLSQGERGRALIARALISDPALLLLDEPSTGLDVAAREQLLETLDVVHSTHPELASVLVTHHLEELPTSTTHALLLRAGRVVALGEAQDVLVSAWVSQTFAHPIAITQEEGRWTARALNRRPTRQPIPPATHRAVHGASDAS
ncbi:iron complex transport system ATP-binding protein [Kribbella antiqua]|uniref:Iron complex transport system ATP-binding protein n=1 Tax=Kribbella antiqua TaxID=2512217 RepID=A0A4R2IVK9_9ACTN|nr:ATP-binding cassette domain-containing protein [Kribbella antiqua]TCO48268.1 iron complex transport system ATP-binding protein [Kribbella antiqua]